MKFEFIGAADCPLMERWTLWESKRLDCKLLVHHFLPNAADPDCHDHPRPFITLVLRGRYDDVVPCDLCNGTGDDWTSPGEMLPCGRCGGWGKVIGETMHAGSLRRRAAGHAHLTRTGDEGAWTVVLMGPKRRKWGFLRAGRWWPFRRYEERFGFHMRCDTESGELMRGTNSKPSFEDIARASEKL